MAVVDEPPRKRRGAVWHPYTQHATAPPPTWIERGEGAWLETPTGRRIFDGISSWWVITHGHRHPRIVEAIHAQVARLDQVIFAGFTHEPAERLAEGLLRVAPRGLHHVFFSDSGSTAVEVALKMALGHFRGRGAPRARIVALEHAYHGDTFGTMSAGARGIFNAAYEPLLFEVDRVPFPRSGAEQATLDALDAQLSGGKVAAFVVEPLLLGGGGMLVYPPWVLAEFRAICARYGTLFVADEVLTGWGRTGTLFACDQAGVEPDILCLAKGLTGGSAPLAVTLCRSEIFESHWSEDRSRAFFHSSSFTANPIACAAAVANLEIWSEEPVRERIGHLVELQSTHREALARDPRLTEVRQMGTVVAFDVPVTAPGYLSDVGLRVTQGMLEHGVLLRPLGNTVYVMPPYCATREELAHVYQAIAQTIEAL